MKEVDKFALVQRPSGVLEKSVPGAKRVLAGMIQDALALARTNVQARAIPPPPSPSYASTGSERWLALNAAAQKLHLPLGHPTEIMLRGGRRLRGELRFANEFIERKSERVRDILLVVGGVTFMYSEIEYCLRLD